VSNLHKNTKKKFSDVAKQLIANEDPETGESAPLLGQAVFDFIQANASALDSAIVFDRDNDFDVFGLKTLQRSYLWKVNGKIVERPQHAMMRIAVGIFQPDLPMVLQAYEIYSKRWATHGSPTWFGAGTAHPTLSSCFLGAVPDDLSGIYTKLKECAMISKGAGGIGLSWHNVRAKGSYIKSTGGSSNGLLPALRVFNNVSLHATHDCTLYSVCDSYLMLLLLSCLCFDTRPPSMWTRVRYKVELA
jgi:ribonucleoside-diphosphate reductase alpha chain